MQQTTVAEVRLDAGRAARFSDSVRSTGGFDRLPRTRCAICRCSRRPEGRSWPRNDPESGECRMNLQLRNILKRPQKKQPDEKRPEGFLDPEDEKACEVARGAFNLLFEGSGVRIFTASHLDLSHRWVPSLGKSDIVIFSDPWALREKIAIKTQECARFPENLYFLCNDWQTYYVRKPHIKSLHVINQNCFMDESIFCIKDKFEKKYDVLYNGRRAKTKR